MHLNETHLSEMGLRVGPRIALVDSLRRLRRAAELRSKHVARVTAASLQSSESHSHRSHLGSNRSSARRRSSRSKHRRSHSSSASTAAVLRSRSASQVGVGDIMKTMNTATQHLAVPATADRSAADARPSGGGVVPTGDDVNQRYDYGGRLPRRRSKKLESRHLVPETSAFFLKQQQDIVLVRAAACICV